MKIHVYDTFAEARGGSSVPLSKGCRIRRIAYVREWDQKTKSYPAMRRYDGVNSFGLAIWVTDANGNKVNNPLICKNSLPTMNFETFRIKAENARKSKDLVFPTVDKEYFEPGIVEKLYTREPDDKVYAIGQMLYIRKYILKKPIDKRKFF